MNTTNHCLETTEMIVDMKTHMYKIAQRKGNYQPTKDYFLAIFLTAVILVTSKINTKL